MDLPTCRRTIHSIDNWTIISSDNPADPYHHWSWEDTMGRNKKAKTVEVKAQATALDPVVNGFANATHNLASVMFPQRVAKGQVDIYPTIDGNTTIIYSVTIAGAAIPVASAKPDPTEEAQEAALKEVDEAFGD